jgi:uncharacterized iron-regulated membrane protein
MLEVVVLLLGVATCALILMAFWGVELLWPRPRPGAKMSRDGRQARHNPNG